MVRFWLQKVVLAGGSSQREGKSRSGKSHRVLWRSPIVCSFVTAFLLQTGTSAWGSIAESAPQTAQLSNPQTKTEPQPSPEQTPTPTNSPNRKPENTTTKQPVNKKQPEKKKPSNQQEDEFPPNPLMLKTPDPLLPKGDLPLTDTERKQLVATLDALNAKASAELKQGNKEEAYEIWFRELRSRRALGSIQEIQALGRVGDIAWSDNRITEVRWITERLDTILAETQDPPQGTTQKPTQVSKTTPKSAADTASRNAKLEALGVAYQQIRLPSQAIVVYEQLLAEAQQRKDAKKVEQTQLTLAQLHMGWFDYAKAAATYRDLLETARAKGDRQNEVIYLSQLAYIHEQAKQPEQAIGYQQQLVELYQALKNPEPIPSLKIKIADNYQLIARPDLAEQNYQIAYKLSQPLLQFGFASDALQKLGALYKTNNRLDAALRVYSFLIAVEQQAYNYIGMMNAYDQIGQIHLSRQAYPQALAAFQQGLVLAKQIKYREDYFTTQIQQIAQQGR